MIMTEAKLQKICIESDLYRTPELNEVLYCNFKGFSSIGGLERYTALRALFLEGNALQSLSGLPYSHLSCLYVQNNSIDDLSALQSLPGLKVLNISNNQVKSLQGIEACQELHTLICSGNKLASLQAILPLRQCPELSTLDLQDNQLEDTEMMNMLCSMGKLCSLYMKDNPFLEKVSNFRKRIIAKLPELAYLDDRPIFQIERQGSEAWLKGGPEAEKVARQSILQEKHSAELENMRALQAMRAESFQKRRQALGLPPGDTDPFFDNLQVDEEETSGPCSQRSEDGKVSSSEAKQDSESAKDSLPDAVPEEVDMAQNPTARGDVEQSLTIIEEEGSE